MFRLRCSLGYRFKSAGKCECEFSVFYVTRGIDTMPEKMGYFDEVKYGFVYSSV